MMKVVKAKVFCNNPANCKIEAFESVNNKLEKLGPKLMVHGVVWGWMV